MNTHIRFKLPRGMPEDFMAQLRGYTEEGEKLAWEMHVPNPLLRDADFCYDWLTTIWWAHDEGSDPHIRLKKLLSERRRQYFPTVPLDENFISDSDTKEEDE